MFSPRPQFCRDNIHTHTVRLAFRRDCYKTKHIRPILDFQPTSYLHMCAHDDGISRSQSNLTGSSLRDRIPIVGLPKLNDHYTQRAHFRYG